MGKIGRNGSVGRDRWDRIQGGEKGKEGEQKWEDGKVWDAFLYGEVIGGHEILDGEEQEEKRKKEDRGIGKKE